MITLKYDSESNLSYGYWHCPQCKATFFGGGPALHERDCPDAPNKYKNLIYRFTRQEVEQCKAGLPTFGPLRIDIIREQFPELL